MPLLLLYLLFASSWPEQSFSVLAPGDSHLRPMKLTRLLYVEPM